MPNSGANNIVKTPRYILLLLVGITASISAMVAPAAEALPNGAKGNPNMKTHAPSFDSPAVLAVIFHPRPEGAVLAGGFENLTVPVGDGVMLGGRFYSAGTNNPTILFFHGNGEIVADYAELAKVYTGMGINFMPMDYRGYGRSSGTPTVTAMLKDAHAAFDFSRRWLKDHGYTGRFVVMGRSLGSASALELASAHTNEIDALIIDSGFADALGLAQRLGWRPAGNQAMEDTLFRHCEKIRLYKGPTLIIHGTQDTIIPVADADALYQASGSVTKKMLRIRGADHNNLLAVGFDEYFKAVSNIVLHGAQAQTGR